MAPLFSLCPNGTVAQDQLSRVAEDPLLLLVVLPPIEAAALRIPTLVVVVLLQLVVDLPGVPVALCGGDAELLFCPEHIIYVSNARRSTDLHAAQLASEQVKHVYWHHSK